MTACERTGCEHRHIDDDGLCRCPWDGGEAHEMGDEMGEQERDPLDELREADRWKTKKFYDRIADSWQAEREEWGRQLRRRDETIERYVKGQVKMTNNNLSQLVESRDRWKLKAEAAKRSFEAISDTLDDVRDEVIRLEHERDELCEVGITRWYSAYEYGHFYYAFDLKDGSQHYWTDIRESNLRKILTASGIKCRDNLACDVHPKRRDGGDAS